MYFGVPSPPDQNDRLLLVLALRLCQKGILA